ncbi:MAG: HK97 gp10 family phage protein [Oscillospiraceae bacterium]|nr:HK97 gp10 family phage protein [Oscillospiraceae bacterium]MCR5844625.1 HK97 gp10 family phage protein [Oscillospiraceae bacterium]
MGKTIKPEQLAQEVMSGLEEYKDLAVDVLKKEIQEAGKTAKKQIEQTAPRRTGRYAKSWAVKKVSETSSSLEVTVHSRNRYMLTHLLENGHAKRGGGRVAAIPHIAPAEEAAAESLERNIETALGRL